MKKSTFLGILFIYSFQIAFAQTITLDPSFGTAGIVKTDVGPPFNYSNFGRQVLVQSDGRVYLVIEVNGNTLIEKKLPNGRTDSSYGGDGFSVSVPFFGSEATVQPDGKIIVVGMVSTRNYYNTTDIGVARFNSDGTLDNTFGENGLQTTDIGQTDTPYSVITQSDGKIVISVYTFAYGFTQYSELVRYSKNGSLDSTFGEDGITILTINNGSYQSLAIQSDGKIVVGGSFNGMACILRYTIDGSLDSSFGQDALQIVDSTIGGVLNSLFIQADGKIIAGGYTNNGTNTDFVLARLNIDGSPDSTFNGNGIQTTDFGNADIQTSMALQNDGKIILGGYTSDGSANNFAIARYNTDGSMDNSYGSQGKQTTDFGSSNDYANSIAIQSDNKLLALGYTVNGVNTSLAIARYNTDGTTDNSFNGDGLLVDHMSQGDTYYTSTGIQSDGKIVAGGYTWNGSNYDFALARYNTNGSLDNTFSSDGKEITDFGSTDDKARALAIQSDGKILIAGTTGANLSVARYNTNGSPDISFDGDGRLSSDFASPDSAATLLIQADGKILLGGSMLARYNANGSPDLNFGAGGKITAPFDEFDPFNCSAGALQNDGKLVITGRYNTVYGTGLIIARYDINGLLDSTFGENGLTIISPPPGGEVVSLVAKSIAIENDGKIVIGGYLQFYYRTSLSIFILTRLNADGNLDDTFGASGILSLSTGNSNIDHGNSVLIQTDNKIILAGYSFNGINDNFSITRCNNDGSLDNTFGENGIQITHASTANSRIEAIVLGDANLYAVGYGQYPGNLGVVAKYLLGPGGLLPLTFTDFTAELNNKSVVLRWQTASEYNLSFFIIERSADGNSFSAIGNVAAIGNSRAKTNYTRLDQQPLQGINFYRLKIFDLDGKFEYSKIVAVNINQPFTLKIFPNPASDILFVKASGENEKATFQIIDAAGRKLKEGKVILNGNTSFSIYINFLSKGIYNLELRAKSKIETRQFIKK